MLPTASTSRYGPADGDEGLRKNVAFFEKWRKEVGPDFPLALDCYMALSVPYSIKLGKARRPLVGQARTRRTRAASPPTLPPQLHARW